jgi:putative toxin-antitoxin system antitoxin component (TIGR02293 family)
MQAVALEPDPELPQPRALSEEDRILRLLNHPQTGDADLVELARRGIGAGTAKALMSQWDLEAQQFTAILGTSPRTLARRVQNKQSLDSVESDRLIRFLRLMARAEEALGDTGHALDWLKRENRALDGITPLALLDTDPGVERVEEILNRIAFGVYS